MSKAIRQVYGEKLAALGEQRRDIVVLDADVSSSTQTKFFAKAHPDRFFNMGIAEANMTATAAGLAIQGSFLLSTPLRFSLPPLAMFPSGRWPATQI